MREGECLYLSIAPVFTCYRYLVLFFPLAKHTCKYQRICKGMEDRVVKIVFSCFQSVVIGKECFYPLASRKKKYKMNDFFLLSTPPAFHRRVDLLTVPAKVLGNRGDR